MRAFSHYLVPGLVFQSVVVGGGYATGRELVEFFLTNGPVGGLLGLLVTAVCWSIILMLTFEFARLTQAFDYRSFFKELLGRFWILFEIPFFFLAFLVLAVLGAASGNIFSDQFGVNPLFGSIGLMMAIAVLAFQKSDLIEGVMAAWAFILYIAYGVLIVWGYMEFRGQIIENFKSDSLAVAGDWLKDGLTYAGYNVAAIPAVLFALVHLSNRRESFAAGALGGLLGILPALFLYVVMIGFYPGINGDAVPLTYILGRLDAPWFSVLFHIVIFGTFIQTGTALIHMLNERIDHTFQEREQELPPAFRPFIAVLAVSAAVFVAARVGIISIIANGYGLLTYGFFAVYVVPVLTIGVRRILRSR